MITTHIDSIEVSLFDAGVCQQGIYESQVHSHTLENLDGKYVVHSQPLSVVSLSLPSTFTRMSIYHAALYYVVIATHVHSVCAQVF